MIVSLIVFNSNGFMLLTIKQLSVKYTYRTEAMDFYAKSSSKIQGLRYRLPMVISGSNSLIIQNKKQM